MTLTRLSKGWFRTFGLEHWPEICECPWSNSGGMARKIIEDSRIIFGGNAMPWSVDRTDRYSTESTNSWGWTQLVPNPSKSTVHNTRLRSLAEAFSTAPVVPEFKVGDIVLHETMSYQTHKIPNEALRQAREKDTVRFAARQTIKEWGNPRMHRGWYDARGSGIPDDYGRFIDVGEYQLEGEDAHLKEALESFRQHSVHYKNHPEDIDRKWQWSVAYAGSDKPHAFKETRPPEGILNVFETMHARFIRLRLRFRRMVRVRGFYG
jgi:hypothetical protein